jgi:site-specific DNA recombinase
VDAERAALITWAFERYATGRYSPQQMATELQRRGLTTRPSPSRPARPLHRRLVSFMLRDPYYCGSIRYKGKLYTGRHQPLVSDEVFEVIQQVLATQAGEGTRDVVHLHYLRGKVFCGECRTAGRPGRMVYSRNRGRGGTYEYLVCAARQRRLCTAPTVRVDLVEARLAAIMATERMPLEAKARTQKLICNLETVWATAPDAVRRDLLTTFFKDIVIYTSVPSESAS